MTKAMPQPAGTWLRNFSRASSPPAEQPMPMTGKGRVGSLGEGAAGQVWGMIGRVYPCRRLNPRNKIANSSSGLKGLIRKSFMPAARHFALSSAKALAVMAMIGMS